MIRATIIWSALTIALVAPLIAAAESPLLAWREPVYIAAGFAGIVCMELLLLQPLLAGRQLPYLSPAACRSLHRLVGLALIAAILVHVGGLWVTSPPDVVDALLFTSPTPFSAWGVVAMWAAFATALLGIYRFRLNLRFRLWRFGHTGLAAITIIGSVVHALLIEGTMEIMTKTALCCLVLLASVRALANMRVWEVRRRA